MGNGDGEEKDPIFQAQELDVSTYEIRQIYYEN
jgi:hypothetical protein